MYDFSFDIPDDSRHLLQVQGVSVSNLSNAVSLQATFANVSESHEFLRNSPFVNKSTAT